MCVGICQNVESRRYDGAIFALHLPSFTKDPSNKHGQEELTRATKLFVAAASKCACVMGASAKKRTFYGPPTERYLSHAHNDPPLHVF